MPTDFNLSFKNMPVAMLYTQFSYSIHSSSIRKKDQQHLLLYRYERTTIILIHDTWRILSSIYTQTGGHILFLNFSLNNDQSVYASILKIIPFQNQTNFRNLHPNDSYLANLEENIEKMLGFPVINQFINLN